MYRVSVVISTYNGAKNIIRQLDSILSQKNLDVLIYIRDDSSSDDTVKIVENYIEEHQKHNIYITKGENVGYAKSFWLALCNAPKADFYAFSDQDDVWLDNKLWNSIKPMVEDKYEGPQLSYCRMIRADESLSPLSEQVDVLKPEELSYGLTLTQTFNYGAATVINNSAKELFCMHWPEVSKVPHDLWCGILSYWLGRVYFVDENLYYWIRYTKSVTGEGTKKSGIKYRINETIRGDSYPNVSKDLLVYYNRYLSSEQKQLLECVCEYKNSIKKKCSLLLGSRLKRNTIAGTIALKLGILMNWF